MGTRINVLFEHHLPDYRNGAHVIGLLHAALPAALSVRDHWSTNSPDSRGDDTGEWMVLPDHALEGKGLPRYKGPGSLVLTLSRHVAHLRSGGRWRGFLSINALRTMHLVAFRSVAASLGATEMALFRDDDSILESFWEDKTQEECVAQMKQLWGPAQPSIVFVDPKIVAETDHEPPAVWYLESVQTL